MTRLFLPHPVLEEWATDDRADLRGEQLFVAADQESYGVVPAVLFTQLVSGNDDRKLLSKVKTEAQLKELGAEQMADSVILGDDAYEVVTGYVTQVSLPAAAPPGKAPAKPAAEADLLAAYFLDKIGP